jgi:hypothetical protein
MRKSIINIITLAIIVLFNFSCEKEISTSPPTKPVPVAYIFIDSNPTGAKIYEDGKFSGKVTPDSLNWLEEKTYLFTLKKELYRDTSFSVNISKDERKEIFVDYFQNQKMYGKIDFISTPDSADIFLNGDSTGFTTPDTLSGIIPGDYHIVYKKENCITDSLDITVRSNEISQAYLPLVDTTYWVEYSAYNSRFPINQLTSIAIDHNGLMWIGSNGGLFSFNGSEWTEYNTLNSGLVNDFVKIIEIDDENIKWIGTIWGLNKFNGNIWITYQTNRELLPSNYVYDIVFLSNGSLLLATPSGLIKRNGFNWEVLYEYSCNGVTIDSRGRLWVTRGSAGIASFINAPEPYQDYWRTYYTPGQTGEFNHLYKCVSSSADVLWFGHYQDRDHPNATYGLSSIKIGDHVRRTHYPLFDGVTVNRIKMRNNEKWICSNNGLYVFEDYSDVKRFHTGNTPLTSNNISDVDFDHNGNAWVTTFYSGLFKFKIPWD